MLHLKRAICAFSLCLTFWAGEALAQADAAVVASNVSYDVEWTDYRGPYRKIAIPGALRIPKDATGKVPAVVLLHSAGGVDGTGLGHAVNLNAAGFATLEIDMFRARGQRERGELIQTWTMPDLYGALEFLAEHPAVDPARIAVSGYSYGGIMTILALSGGAARKHQFAAHVAYYPVCYMFGRELGGQRAPYWSAAQAGWTGRPLLIIAGAKDEYERPDTCLKLRDSLPEANRAATAVHVYPDAGHGFDVPHGRSYRDPWACLGRGCTVNHQPNRAATGDAYKREVEFLRAAFGLSGPKPPS